MVKMRQSTEWVNVYKYEFPLRVYSHPPYCFAGFGSNNQLNASITIGGHILILQTLYFNECFLF